MILIILSLLQATTSILTANSILDNRTKKVLLAPILPMISVTQSNQAMAEYIGTNPHDIIKYYNSNRKHIYKVGTICSMRNT